MRRSLLVVVTSAVTVALIAFSLLVVGAGWLHPEAATGTGVQATDPGDDPDDAAEQEPDAENERGGPPPWAHAASRGHAKGSLDAWKKLTPAEREKLMMRLVKEHDDGMRAYRACRDQGHRDCVKPLPPGLAKRR